MSRALKAELSKLRSVRTTWVLVAVALGLEVVFASLSGAFLGPGDDSEEYFGGLGLLPVFGVCLGVLLVANEFRFKLATITFLASPKRLDVLAAKVVVGFVGGLLLGLAAAVLNGVVLGLVLSSRGIEIPAFGELLELEAISVLVCGLATAFGVGLACLVRNQAAALVLGIVILSVLRAFTGLLPDDVRQFFPAEAMAALGGRSDAEGDGYLTQVLGGVVFAAWALLLAIGGAALLRRADVAS